MIELKLTVDELDYDGLLERYLPLMTEKLRESGSPVGMLLSNGMPASMAKKIIAGLPKATKDKLTADLLNANEEKLREALEQFATEQGVSLRVGSIRAEVK
ncbi:MAG: hypothetical protein VB055_05815 [Oscillospiraceae bacterium]|nr:hypothetical protein [Oscillospiraceae bacterium]